MALRLLSCSLELPSARIFKIASGAKFSVRLVAPYQDMFDARYPPGNPPASPTAENDVKAGPNNPYFTQDFARIYERTGNRIMAPVAVEALRLAGSIGRGKDVLDIGAGAGSLSIPAAFSGANVLAVDIAPGMIELLSEHLLPFPNAEAKIMDGQSLAICDNSFDLAFSIVGTPFFSDWRKGLREQHRVLRDGGRACIAVWKIPPGGGPFLVMAKAIRSVFPDSILPAGPDGFLALSDKDRLVEELKAAGFGKVDVTEFDAIWEGPAGGAYLDELRGLHGYMMPYRILNFQDRQRIESAILDILHDYTENGKVTMSTPILIAVADKEPRCSE